MRLKVNSKSNVNIIIKIKVGVEFKDFPIKGGKLLMHPFLYVVTKNFFFSLISRYLLDSVTYWHPSYLKREAPKASAKEIRSSI